MKHHKGGIVRFQKGPDALDNIDGEIKILREEIKDILSCIKILKKENQARLREIKNLKIEEIRLEQMRKSVFKISACKHLDDQNDRIGLGYAGDYCSTCGSLMVKDEYILDVGFNSWIPDHPFKKNCKHEWVTRKEFKKPILCMGGRWCKICGRIESTNEGR